MRRFFILLLFLSGSTLLAAPDPSADPAPGFLPIIQADSFRLNHDRLYPDELWVMARTIRIEGEARDDLFLLAGSSRLGFSPTNTGLIALTGRVGGSCWAAGMKLDLAGDVERHVRLAGQVARLDGRIGGNLLAAAATVSLDTNAMIAGSARILADYLILRGTVDGDLRVSARKVVLDGVVNGNADIQADSLSILANTRIRGSLSCLSPNPVHPSADAAIDGGLTHREPSAVRGLSLLGTLLSLLGAILTGMFFILFSPRLVARSVFWMEAAPWRTLLTGFALFILIPFAILFAFASLLGIPLSLVSAGLYGLGLYLGRFVAALAVARLVTGLRQRQPFPFPSAPLMLLGLALFHAASLLPEFLADAVWFWFTVSGMGALFLAIRGTPPLPFPIPPPPPPESQSDSGPST